MNTVRLLNTEGGQTVCLPDNYQLPGNEAGIMRHGRAIIIFPVDNPWQGFFDSWDKFTPDFMENREQLPTETRENL